MYERGFLNGHILKKNMIVISIVWERSPGSMLYFIEIDFPPDRSRGFSSYLSWMCSGEVIPEGPKEN